MQGEIEISVINELTRRELYQKKYENSTTIIKSNFLPAQFMMGAGAATVTKVLFSELLNLKEPTSFEALAGTFTDIKYWGTDLASAFIGTVFFAAIDILLVLILNFLKSKRRDEADIDISKWDDPTKQQFAEFV